MKAIIGFGELKELVRTDKGMRLILIAGAALILIIALAGAFGGSGKSEKSASALSADQLAEYEHELEQRLSAILSEIDGVGKARVMVTLDTSEQNEYGKNADMLISVTAPKVRGVIVVCEGGGSVAVQEKVVSAVTGVFGISSLRISVAAG